MGLFWFQVSVVTVLVAALTILIWKVKNLKIREQDQADLLEKAIQKIEDIRAAEALTDKHRKDIAILNNDQDDISDDLRDAQGKNDPLPPDVIRALDRLRT